MSYSSFPQAEAWARICQTSVYQCEFVRFCGLAALSRLCKMLTGSFSHNKRQRGNQILYSFSSQPKKDGLNRLTGPVCRSKTCASRSVYNIQRGLTAALPMPSSKRLFRGIRAPEAVRRAFRADDLGATKNDGNDGEWAHVFPQFLQRYWR